VTDVGIERPRDMRIDRLRASSAAGPASRQAYRALRDAIISTELEPGQRLSENELAERLAVSRTPIREALIRLRDDRFVQIVPQLGTFVTRISTAAVEDAQFIRESLECAAVRLAATRAQPGDLAVRPGDRRGELAHRPAPVLGGGALGRAHVAQAGAQGAEVVVDLIDATGHRLLAVPGEVGVPAQAGDGRAQGPDGDVELGDDETHADRPHDAHERGREADMRGGWRSGVCGFHASNVRTRLATTFRADVKGQSKNGAGS